MTKHRLERRFLNWGDLGMWLNKQRLCLEGVQVSSVVFLWYLMWHLMQATDRHDLRFLPSMFNKLISVTSVLDVTVANTVPRSEWRWGHSLFYRSLYLPAASVSKRCCWQTLDETNSLCSSEKNCIRLCVFDLTTQTSAAPLVLEAIRPFIGVGLSKMDS